MENDSYNAGSEMGSSSTHHKNSKPVTRNTNAGFKVGDVMNVFSKDNRRCRTTSAGGNEMRRKTSKNWSVNSASTEFHHHGSQNSNNASNQSAETAYKLNEDTSRKTCVVNALLTTKPEQGQETQRVHEQEKVWDYQTYLTSIFMRLKMILGRNPEIVELYDAGFSMEEIDLMESLTDWMYESDGLEEWEPISSIERILGSGVT
jgi:hypothetical protein